MDDEDRIRRAPTGLFVGLAGDRAEAAGPKALHEHLIEAGALTQEQFRQAALLDPRIARELAEVVMLEGWTRATCPECGVAVAAPTDSVLRCSNGHDAPMEVATDGAPDAIVQVLASALRAWIGSLPLEAAVAARLERTHALDPSEADLAVIEAVAVRVRGALERWPTNDLALLPDALPIDPSARDRSTIVRTIDEAARNHFTAELRDDD